MIYVTHLTGCPALEQGLTKSCQLCDCHFTVPQHTHTHTPLLLKINDSDSSLATGFGTSYTLKFPMTWPHWCSNLTSHDWESLSPRQDALGDIPSQPGTSALLSHKGAPPSGSNLGPVLPGGLVCSGSAPTGALGPGLHTSSSHARHGSLITHPLL